MDADLAAVNVSEASRSRLADFRLIADLCGIDLLVSDAVSGRFIDCNTSAHTRLGYSRNAMLALSPEAIQADPDHDAAWVAERRRELLASGGGCFHTRHRCRDDRILDVEVRHLVLTLDDRQLIVSLVRDRTSAKQREARLEEALRLLGEGEAISGIGVWDLRFADGRMRWSEQMRRLCGGQAGDDPQTFWAYGTLVHPDDRNRWRNDFQRAANRGDHLHHRHRLMLADGPDRPVEIEARFSYDHSGQPVRAVGTLRDLSDERNRLLNQALERSHDPLTGLPNKLAAREELGRRLNGRRYNASLALLSLDVDGFQEINDNFGTDIGDRVMRVIARRLHELLGSKAWLARFSSDQFLVVIEENIHSLGDAMAAGRQLQQLWNEQNQLLAEIPLIPTFSIGLATYPEHAQDAKALIRCANTALMKAKTLGRIQMCAYSSTFSRQIKERMQLSSDLAQAINREQLRLVVQPQVERGSQLVGAEMLLRWTDHLGRAIPPKHFIPLAEESGQIIQLGTWVLQTTVQRLAVWRKAGLQPPRLGLNVSPRELEMPGRRFISSLLDHLSEHQLSPDQIELEITETTLLHNPLMAREQLMVLADQGFRIAIDDFGTGYSSLELLRTLPVHRLKIDRTFVQHITTSREDRTIVQATIILARGLGMECVAEGVETEEQRQLLGELGCHTIQGYLCGRPMELDAFETLLRSASTNVQAAPQAALPKCTAVHHSLLGQGAIVPSTFEQLELLRSAFDATDDYFLLLQTQYRHDGKADDFLILEANQSACRHLEQDRDAIVGQTLLAIFPHMQQNGLLDLCVDAISRNSPVTVNDFAYENHGLFRDNRCYDIQILPSRGFLVVHWRDVSERARAQRSLAEAAALHRLLTENIVEVVVLLNLQERVVWVSPSLQPMTGWQEAQWKGKRFRELFARAEGRPEPLDLQEWLQHSGPIRQGRLRLHDPRGGWNWVQLSARRLHPGGRRRREGAGVAATGSGAPGHPDPDDGYVLSLQLVDDLVLEERRLLQMANSDPLTGLESRAAILGRLERRLLDDRRGTAQELALLFCDFDDFKGINDTHGHACGDQVLQTVARRISSVVRCSDHVGRLGGDEFLVLLEGIRSLPSAHAVADKLRDLMAEPIAWGDLQILASLSIGVVVHGAGEDADLLLRRADRSMYANKASRSRTRREAAGTPTV